MRTAWAVDATLQLEPDADRGAPGAAITVALCGAWQHPGPCPLAAHHTAVLRGRNELRLRVLLASEATDRQEVWRRLRAALDSGVMAGPDGTSSRWTLRSCAEGAVRAEEADH